MSDNAGSNALDKQNDNQNMPSYSELQEHLNKSVKLVDDVVMKNYLPRLSDLRIIPLDDSAVDIGDIRLFKITEMVYQNNENSMYKFASVFNSLRALDCGVYIVMDSNGTKTDFYMGVRNLSLNKTTASMYNTLESALKGQFPGVKTNKLTDADANNFLNEINGNKIASVSCIAGAKDNEFKDNEKFIQGLEKLALAMQGKKYTAVILASNVSDSQIAEYRKNYEIIYTNLSPFAQMQLNYGSNSAMSVANAFTHGTSETVTETKSFSRQKSESVSSSSSVTKSESTPDKKAVIAKALGSAALGVASIVTAPLTGGASIVAAGAILAGGAVVNSITPKTKTAGTTDSHSSTETSSETEGESTGTSKGSSESKTDTETLTFGESKTMQLTAKNKTIENMLARIDRQLKRIDECESIGMWECAAYFISNEQATTEMAAGTYKALMEGEQTGIEKSAINFWGGKNDPRIPELRKYIANFMHPAFEYETDSLLIPVTPASLISSNELSINMSLPRKSVCGFPVIEHEEFGKEVVSYSPEAQNNSKSLVLGKVFNMGSEHKNEVKLDIESLAMHTFVTGSTGAGKSNTIYHMLSKLKKSGIKFLVIEPAKGEYKNVFGGRKDVRVLGTNAKYAELLKINPFSFPDDVHVLEHIDRLVEIFNVCWPMYAAMPAILKDAVERAYLNAGWDLGESTCKHSVGQKKLYPCFVDVLKQIVRVVNESGYSDENKSDYIGALCTRVKSLTNGLYSRIFTPNEIEPSDLFDKNTVVDLSRIGSTETKALIMGLLVLKMQEYRMSQKTENNAELRHVTVLEEAHTLLKRTSTEQSSETANLLGKSVEMLANSIAEMRTYGEGFIIADQSPGLLDMSVIRNTNTKIILRLPDMSDRQLVGRAASLNDNQITELSKLKTGVAAVYQNDWLEPVLCKVTEFDEKTAPYAPSPDSEQDIELNRKRQLIDYVMLPAGERPEITVDDIDEMKQAVFKMNISSDVKRDILKYISEDDPDNIQVLRGRIIYGVFNSETALSLSNAERSDIYSWENMMLDKLVPDISGMDTESINKILGMLVRENTKHNPGAESVKLCDDFAAYHNKDRRDKLV